MKETQLARRYALALFSVARELKLTTKVAEDFDQLITVIRQNSDFRTLLNSPVIPAHKKISILKSLFSPHMHELSIRFMILLAKHERERYLELVAEQIGVLYHEFMGIVIVRVTSAAPLSTENRNQLLEHLNETLGDKLELQEVVDPELVGGFILDWNDQRYDASLLRQVKELRKEFQENLYVRQF
ncbi:MAG TPA: ATP synthase F1 subunit delta [Bacteroidales bacterium]|nr:MAG: ATP synthase F1 subunit delta [Bacteroidetes bacterium GWE2_42_24]OFY27560.1 MAG: ATP synthase F1 subunit delta [Bacteroidetes bacterium GWF2_43_11]PKP15592.1 MAG: ATP synthase F1 subunit delta [Bacteroidetes bacterium HGW-Bacteroidetes-22]HAQ64960.1 ATP synthase F1 subunit delta [Bacteroidales bacterium]HBZ66084.1 ATP synthase F1 subunit delta [Bacteroidales bacterium]